MSEKEQKNRRAQRKSDQSDDSGGIGHKKIDGAKISIDTGKDSNISQHQSFEMKAGRMSVWKINGRKHIVFASENGGAELELSRQSAVVLANMLLLQ